MKKLTMLAVLAALLLSVSLLVGCGSDGGDGKKDDDIATDDTGGGGPGDIVAEDEPSQPEDAPAMDVPEEELPQTECIPSCMYADGQYCDLESFECLDIACETCWKDKDCPGGFCIVYEFSVGGAMSVCSMDCQADTECAAGFICGDTGACEPTALCPADGCGGEGTLGSACAYEDVNLGCGECGDGLKCLGATNLAGVDPCVVDADCGKVGLPKSYHPQCIEGTCGYSFCSEKCTGVGECPDGFGPEYGGFLSCYCYPVGTAVAGEPCPFFGVHEEAEECGANLSCLGIAPDEETDPCQSDADCDNFFLAAPAQCVDGFCGISFCSPRCDKNGICEDGFAPINVSGNCFCGPVNTGDAKAGDPCPSGDIHADADHCTPGTLCLGWGGTEESDPCVADAECPLSIWNGNPVCLEGFCATSFCSPYCDENDDCPEGFQSLTDGFGCYCIPRETGDSEAGEACPYGKVNAEADFCAADLSCLASSPDEESDDCQTAADCPVNLYPGAPACVENKCSFSFCSPDCNDAGECEVGFEPILVGDDDTCYCAPKEIGEGELGDACPLGYMNLEADACLDNLVCLGSVPDEDEDEEEGDECVTVDDCPASMYPGNIVCVDGFCGSSWCASDCLENDGECPVGYLDIASDPEDEDEYCYCMPKHVGEATEGQSCPAGDVNPEADGCLAELTCVVISSDAEEPDVCDTAADCLVEDYKGTVACVDGECASTFCAQECDDQGACAEYFEPWGEEEDVCYCAPGANWPPACSETCEGCCTEDACLAGDTDEACGTAGAECVACQGGTQCVANECVCVAEDHKGCGEDGNVYWFDSCDVQGVVAETCENGQACIIDVCGCVAEATQGCGADGNVHFFDSCGVEGEQVKACDNPDVCFEDDCCTPDCTDKDCGPDGCGSECGPACEAGFECNAEGKCEQQ